MRESSKIINEIKQGGEIILKKWSPVNDEVSSLIFSAVLREPLSYLIDKLFENRGYLHILKLAKSVPVYK